MNNGGHLITLDIRLAGQVKRYHTWPTHRQQTVGEHTWQVLRIYSTIFGPPDPSLLLYILYHDCGELVTGDLPFPVKSENPVIGAAVHAMEDDAKQRLGGQWSTAIPLDTRRASHIKVSELIEMAEEGFHEHALGSMYGWIVAARTLDKAYAMLDKFNVAEETLIRTYVVRRLNLLKELNLYPGTAPIDAAKWSEPIERHV